MSEGSLTEFSGVAGKVLRRAIGGGSLITGIVIGFALLVANWVLVLLDAAVISTPLTQAVLALVLARFAVNGLYGEWGGTVFSGVGGSWGTVTRVALRYLALTAVWLLPMLLIGLKLDPGAAMGPSMISGKVMTFGSLYLLAMTLTPPLFLIAAVSASNFGESFSPDHWKTTFSGRLGDLFAVYVVYTGALGMVILIAITPVSLAFSLNTNLGFVIAGICLCMLFGVSVNLLGRLSGFFACGDLGLSETSPPDVVRSAPTAPPAGQPEVEASAAPPVPAAVAAQPQPPAPPVPATSAAHASASRAVATAAPVATEVESHHVPALASATEKRRPPLLDGQQRVEAALKRFTLDPDGALSALKDLNETFAPHPHVLQAYANCLYQTNHSEVAIELARGALELCFERGHTKLAAGIFTTMYRDLDRLGFNREQLLTVAALLERTDDLAAAARAYSTVIGEDRGSVQAIKGLLQVADRILNERSHPAAARKVYRYLMEHCSDSPLREYMTQGLAAAERRLDSRAQPDA